MAIQRLFNRITSFSKGRGNPPEQARTHSAPRRLVFTICSKNYISYANTLLHSVKEQHPEIDVLIVLADKMSGLPSEYQVFPVIESSELGIPAHDHMAFRYTVMEFNTAIKPFCFEFLFERNYDQVVYLDPDIRLYAPIDVVFQALDEGAPVVLTPHIESGYSDTEEPSDLTIMRSGIYNLGFVAMRNVASVHALLIWWEGKLERDCIVDLPNGLFVDQKWMDFVPAFIPFTKIIYHKGYNVAYWNLPLRPWVFEGSFLFGGDPLVFFHFSGIDPGDPSVFSKHQTRYRADRLGAILPLLKDYRERLIENGWSKTSKLSYVFDKFSDGRRILPQMRQFVRRNEVNILETVADPFSYFAGWFDERSDDHPYLPRVVLAVWSSRGDLQKAFDINCLGGTRGLLEWFVDNAGSEVGVDPKSLECSRSALSELKANQVALQPTPVFDAGPYPRWLGDAWMVGNHLSEPTSGKLDQITLPLIAGVIWRQRPDLQAVYPIDEPESVPGLLHWMIVSGAKEGWIPEEVFEKTFGRWMGEWSEEGVSKGQALTQHLAVNDWPCRTPAEKRAEANTLWYIGSGRRHHKWGSTAVQSTIERCNQQHPAFAKVAEPLTHSMHAIYELRDDLKERFDLRTPTGREEFLRWYLFHGMDEYHLTVENVSVRTLEYLASLGMGSLRNGIVRQIWLARIDLQQLFDYEDPAGRSGLLGWFSQHGATEFSKAPVVGLVLQRDPCSTKKLVDAVVVGPFRHRSGRGQDARRLLESLKLQDLDVCSFDIDTGSMEHNEMPIDGERISGRSIVFCTNADTALQDIAAVPFSLRKGARLIGFWAWELGRFPDQYTVAFDFFDEIWSHRGFAYRAIASASSRPVKEVPVAVTLTASHDEDEIELPGDREAFTFFYAYNSQSFSTRKNPLAAVHAFQRAFPREGFSRVRLLIKLQNASSNSEAEGELRAIASQDYRIQVFERELSDSEMHKVVRQIDCFVSLHRSEGFGRSIAEAMLAGKPVVVTAYSGNMSFTTEENSFLVQYDLVDLKAEEYLGWQGQVWANPIIEHAAETLRAVYYDQVARQRKAKLGREKISQDYSVDAAGKFCADLLTLPYTGWLRLG